MADIETAVHTSAVDDIKAYLNGDNGAELDGASICWPWLRQSGDFTLFDKLRLVYEFDAPEQYKKQLETTQVITDGSPEMAAFKIWQVYGCEPIIPNLINLHLFSLAPRERLAALNLVQRYLGDAFDSARKERIVQAYLKYCVEKMNGGVPTSEQTPLILSNSDEDLALFYLIKAITGVYFWEMIQDYLGEPHPDIDFLDNGTLAVYSPTAMADNLRMYLNGENGVELDGATIYWPWLIQCEDFTPFEKLRLVYEFDAPERYKKQLETTPVTTDDSPEMAAFEIWQASRCDNIGLIYIQLFKLAPMAPREKLAVLNVVQRYLGDAFDSARKERIVQAYLTLLNLIVPSSGNSSPPALEVILNYLHELLHDSALVDVIEAITFVDIQAKIQDLLDKLYFEQQVQQADSEIGVSEAVHAALNTDKSSPFTDFLANLNLFDKLKEVCVVKSMPSDSDGVNHRARDRYSAKLTHVATSSGIRCNEVSEESSDSYSYDQTYSS